MNLSSKSELTLRFGSYNIQHGGLAELSKLASDITDAELDIVGLQEIDQNTSRNGFKNTMKLLSEYTGYKYYVFFKAISVFDGEYGIGVLSKYPLTQTHLIPLESGKAEQRILGRTEIDVNGTKINFFVTHLSFESKELRAKQFAQVAFELKNFDNFILTGDFNTSDFSEYTAITDAEYVNNKSYSLITFPQNSSSIDNIVYSKSVWKFTHPQTQKNNNSDHYMLYADGTYIGK